MIIKVTNIICEKKYLIIALKAFVFYHAYDDLNKLIIKIVY